MIQFRIDDTVQFAEKFSAGQDGILTISSPTTDTPIDSAATATHGQFTIAATNASFAPGQIIKLVQSQGTGSNDPINWQFNVILAYTAGTITTKYPIDRDFVSGAQVVVFKRYSAVHINAAYTAKAWNGTVGAELGWFCNGKSDGTGSLVLQGQGFRGGAGGPHSSPGAATSRSLQGEGYLGAGTYLFTPNGNAGGGSDGSGADGGSGGGGGANASNGATGGTSQSSPGQGGIAQGSADLKSMVLPGAGGGGRGEKNGSGDGGAGANGPANLTVISKVIDFSALTINSNGSNGSNSSPITSSDGAGGGGASPGGNCLFKFQRGIFSASINTALGATGGAGGTSGSNPSVSNGGNADVGRFHADYSQSINGNTNPALDQRKDYIYNDVQGFFIANML